MSPKTKKFVQRLSIGALAIVLLFLIPPVAAAIVNAIGQVAGWTKDKVDTITEKITDSTKGLVLVAIGLAIVSGAAAFIAAPVIAAGLVIFGLALAGWGVYNIVRPSGQKPDNVKLDGAK